MKTKRLGRGLEALIPQEATESNVQGGSQNSNLLEIEVSLIKSNPFQPRLDFDEKAHQELKDSIREKGIIQPVTVRRREQGYELIAGERRLRAAIEVGLNTVPAYIVQVETKEEMLELALIENVQREKLNPIEQATAFQRLITECNLTQDEVARKIGKDRTTITNLIRLLKLPVDIQASVKTGDLSVGHARALLAVEEKEQQKILWKKTLKNAYSVRKLEKLVREASEITPHKSVTKEKESIYIKKIEEKLRDLFGTKVKVRPRKEGGSIEIDFYSPEDLTRLMEIFEKLE